MNKFDDVQRYSESCMEGGGVATDSNGDLVNFTAYQLLLSEYKKVLKEKLEFSLEVLKGVKE